MRLYYLFLSFLLIFTCIPTQTKQNKAIYDDKKYAVLFDVTNVLIKENQAVISKKIGFGKLASYTVTHWRNPGHRCLDMLATISTHDDQKPRVAIKIQKRILPRCFVELHEGEKTCAQVKIEIAHNIELLHTKKYFSSIKEKNLMTDIMDLVLDPNMIGACIEPVKSSLQLARKLKAAGHSIYVVGNAPDELYAVFQKRYPDLFDFFDGIVISSHIKTVKPGPDVFKHVCSTYNLNPQDCIVIDDLEESVAIAKKLGMQGIVYDKPSNLIRHLKKCGVRF